MKRYSFRSMITIRDTAKGKLVDLPAESFMEENNCGEWVKWEDVRKDIGDALRLRAQRIREGEMCDCCKWGGLDRRTLYMACGYDMSEMYIPFKTFDSPDLPGFNKRQLFTLKVCKSCRSKWMRAIHEWFEGADDE